MKHWVYFLTRKNKVVYIGFTMDSTRRINEHRLSGKKFDSSRTIECKDYDTALKYESRWIKRFKPKYNGDVGRPKGSEKEPMNIFVKKDRAKRLREFAVKEQKTISIVVENALEQTYGI